MGSIPNTIDNFFTNAEAKSYFKDGLAYMRDRLTELGLTTESVLVLFEGEVQVEFPEYPLAFIWVFNTKETPKRFNSGLVSDTSEFFVIELVDEDIETTFSMREQFKRLCLSSPSFTSHDGLNCQAHIVGTEPNIIGEQRHKGVMFYIKIDYKIDGRKQIREYPLTSINLDANFNVEE